MAQGYLTTPDAERRVRALVISELRYQRCDLLRWVVTSEQSVAEAVA
jgi:hypothetical protein